MRWLLAAVALFLIGAAIAPWTVSRDALREDVTAQLRSSTGLYVFTRGRTSVSVLPRPRVHFSDIAFVDPNGALIVESPSLSGDIRLLPLLAGRLEMAAVALASPRITVDVDRRPLTTAGAAVRAAQVTVNSPQAAQADAARLGTVTLVNGSALLRRNGAPVATLDRIDARLDWRTVGAPASLTADFDWLGERQQLIAWVSQPSMLLRGELSPVTAQMRNAQTSLTATGLASFSVQPRYEGRFQLVTSSLPSATDALGLDADIPASLATMSIDGDLVATPMAATLSNMRLLLGADRFEGALALQATETRPLLSATLATPSLILDPYLSGLLAGPAADDAAAQDAPLRKGPDLDLRLSATHLRFRRLQADDAAVSVLAKGQRVELSIADARAYKGTLKARNVIAPASEPGRYDVNTVLALHGVDWGALDWDLAGEQRFAGLADVSLSAQGSGANAGEVARSLRGHARIDVTGGAIAGLDLAGTLARLDKRPLAAATDFRSGRTPFDKASLGLDIDSGAAHVVDGSIAGPGYAMSVAGSVRIPEGQAALRATVRPVADTPERAAFIFEAVGPWTAPHFVPDVRSLIRRSDAASPLFGPARSDAPSAN